jgi:hypothetical protein
MHILNGAKGLCLGVQAVLIDQAIRHFHVILMDLRLEITDCVGYGVSREHELQGFLYTGHSRNRCLDIVEFHP